VGFSLRRLKYMRSFAEVWTTEQLVQQAAQIPWFHNCVLLDRVKDPSERECGSVYRTKRSRPFFRHANLSTTIMNAGVKSVPADATAAMKAFEDLCNQHTTGAEEAKSAVMRGNLQVAKNIGGSVCESNAPATGFLPPAGFEDREDHRTPCASLWVGARRHQTPCVWNSRPEDTTSNPTSAAPPRGDRASGSSNPSEISVLPARRKPRSG